MKKSFTALVKPASSLCNMRCRYCFYADEAACRETASYGIMNRETARALVDRAVAYLPDGGSLHFLFQGGEPTLAGLPFFEEFTAYAYTAASQGITLSFSIQTNGLLLDEQRCAFLQKNRFLVGLSLDAEAGLHDFCRVDAAGAGTFSRVRGAMRLLQRHNVTFNILSVVTRQMAKKPRAVFNACRREGISYLQLIPCLPPLGADRSEFDLTPRLYADFMKQFFRLWAESTAQGGILHVRQFENLILLLRGQPCEQCGMSGRCTPQFVVEGDGSIYPCDFYALDEYRCGNVCDTSVEEVSASEGMRRFLSDSVPAHPLCGDCRVYPLCGGGCRRYRAFYASQPDYCPNQDFLTEIYPTLSALSRQYF